MATTKTTPTKKKSAGTAPAVPPAPTAGPSASAPDVTANFQSLSQSQVRALKKRTEAQAQGAAAAANEVSASKTYVADFGPKAIPQATFAAQLTVAAAWETEHARATAWLAFVTMQRLLAWNATLGSVEIFNQDAKVAALHDPSIPARYPATRALTTSRRAAAERAVATKKNNKKKAAAAPAAAPAPAAPAAPAAKS
jgi:hypothetical protein